MADSGVVDPSFNIEESMVILESVVGRSAAYADRPWSFPMRVEIVIQSSDIQPKVLALISLLMTALMNHTT